VWRGICVLAIAGGMALAFTGAGTAGGRPAVALTAAPPRVTSETTAVFRWAVRPGTRTVCRLIRRDTPEIAAKSRRSHPFRRCSSPARWSSLAPGRRAFVLVAIRGGQETKRVVYRWTISNAAVAPGTSPAPPAPPSPDPPPPPSAGASLKLTFTSTPPATATSQLSKFAWTVSDQQATISCSVDGGSWQSCSSPASVTLPAGNHTFTVRAATAVAAVTATYSWRINLTSGASCAVAPYTVLKPVHPELSAGEQQFVDLVNQARAGLGRAALKVNTKLDLAADSHSYWQDVVLGNSLSHYGCGNSDPGQRIADAGYRASAWGEVTLVSNPPASPQSAFTMFKNSPGHWAILTSPNYTEIGVGASVYHWTGDLASP
jgi:uncharacterized protein YkwD